MLWDDPGFERKAADGIGLSLNPPAHAAVFSVDEKTAFQASDRLDLLLSFSPSRPDRHGFECFRHGALSRTLVLKYRAGLDRTRRVCLDPRPRPEKRAVNRPLERKNVP